MKLNPDCIRDVLFYLEEWLILNDELEFISLDLQEIHQGGNMQKYSLPELAYTLIKMKEAGFIIVDVDYAGDRINDFLVSSITYAGHQFLDAVRPASTWNKIHDVSEKTGLKSISAILEIADILLPETIKSALQS